MFYPPKLLIANLVWNLMFMKLHNVKNVYEISQRRELPVTKADIKLQIPYTQCSYLAHQAISYWSTKLYSM